MTGPAVDGLGLSILQMETTAEDADLKLQEDLSLEPRDALWARVTGF